MKVVGFAGYSGSGKTTLIEKLIPALRARGLRVSVVKHAHHRFDIDTPGKDSWRHRQAGAYEVVVASSQRMALMREFESPADMSPHALIAELQADVDWVLVEGFKASTLPKIEVWRASAGQPARYMEDAQITAIATDSPGQLPVSTALPLLDINDGERVAQFLIDEGARFVYSGDAAD